MLGRLFLGRYEAVRLLGEGGMGRVYLARQIDLGRQVVVKVMHDHIALDPKFRERFQRETLLMARFQHPYVVTLYDASLNDPQGPCIVMEYIRGITLDTLLHNNGRLSPGRVCRILGQLCEALQAAHNEGIVHRDLKPANLMVVDPDTPYEKIKVMDFGLAKLVAAKVMTMQSLHNAPDSSPDFVVGTPGYISPEQVRGEELSHRSDLYSVGIILFEMLTGLQPFTGKETMDVLLAHAQEPPPSFAKIGAGDWVPPAIEQVVMRCLAKNPDERPNSARELYELYEKALTEQPALQEAATPAGAGPAPANQTPTGPASPGQAASAPISPTSQVSPALLNDPKVIVYRMEAWMPDTIASFKLRGFVQDMGGEVIESIPGLIRVRIGGGRSSGPLGWFGLGKKVAIIEVELYLDRANPTQPNMLNVTVIMRSPDPNASNSPLWRERCGQIFCELRSYLAGASVSN